MRLSRLLTAATFVTCFASMTNATADEAAKPQSFTRQSARDILAESRKVVSGHGIETMQKIPINGTEQWISVRGHDTRNPILLYLHGGPGAPDMPLAYTFQTPWEDYFTVVQWDQRGAGKTFAANDPAALASTMTVDQMTADAAEVVSYLRRTYHKQKIFLLGHSWGSVPGVRLAEAHPDWFYAYIGAGQIANMRESEAIGYRFALDEARKQNNQKAVHDLEAIAPYPPPDGKPIDFASIGTQRQWLQYYGGLAWGRTGFESFENAEKISPDYSDEDFAAIDKGSGFTMSHLLGPLTDADFTKTTHFDLPILLFLGRHDYSVSHDVAARWFKTLKAPAKKLVWFEDSAHLMMQEQPGRFLKHLVDDARPYAVKAGDAAPDDIVER